MEVGRGQRLFWESGGEAITEFGGNDALCPPPIPAGLAALLPAFRLFHGTGWTCMAPDPAAAEPQSWSCCCVFLPAPVPAILASSSHCSSHCKLFFGQRGVSPGHGATGRASAGPACAVGQLGRDIRGATGNGRTAGGMDRRIPVPGAWDMTAFSLCKRERRKLARVTCAKRRDPGIPLHPDRDAGVCKVQPPLCGQQIRQQSFLAASGVR